MLGCLFVAILPLPRRAEGLRVGFFGAVMAFVLYDAMRREPVSDPLAEIPAPSAEPGLERVRRESSPLAPVSQDEPDAPVGDEDRLSAIELLTGFSILRHLRRTGAVSDREYETKKANLLRRA